MLHCPKSPDIAPLILNDEKNTQGSSPELNPLIVYERREPSCSVVRMDQVLAGHVLTSLEPGKRKKEKNIVILTRAGPCTRKHGI